MKKMIIWFTLPLVGSIGIMAATVNIDKKTYECLYQRNIMDDDKKAIQFCREAAKKGEPIAEFYLGRLIYSSSKSGSIEEDQSKIMITNVFPKIKALAELGNPYAAVALKNYYQLSWLPTESKDEQMAQKWKEISLSLFKPMLDKGDTYAEYIFYVYSDIESDQNYYAEKLALEKNIFSIQKKLARDYQSNSDKSDFTLTERQQKILQLAAKNGFVYAQHFLGWCYSKGFCGFEKDAKKSFYWVDLASRSKDAYSNVFTSLGYNYANGIGIQQDYKKAIYYTKIAIEKDPNNEDAKNNLSRYERQSKRNPVEEARQAEYDRKHACDGLYPGKNFKVHTTGLFGGDEKARITGVDKDGGQVSFEWYDGAIREWRQEETTCTYLKTQMR